MAWVHCLRWWTAQTSLSKEAQRNATLLFFSHLRATFCLQARAASEYKLTARGLRLDPGRG